MENLENQEARVYQLDVEEDLDDESIDSDILNNGGFFFNNDSKLDDNNNDTSFLNDDLSASRKSTSSVSTQSRVDPNRVDLTRDDPYWLDRPLDNIEGAEEAFKSVLHFIHDRRAKNKSKADLTCKARLPKWFMDRPEIAEKSDQSKTNGVKTTNSSENIVNKVSSVQEYTSTPISREKTQDMHTYLKETNLLPEREEAKANFFATSSPFIRSPLLSPLPFVSSPLSQQERNYAKRDTYLNSTSTMYSNKYNSTSSVCSPRLNESKAEYYNNLKRWQRSSATSYAELGEDKASELSSHGLSSLKKKDQNISKSVNSLNIQ